MIEQIQGIKTDKNTNFYIDLKRLNPIKEELETFLKDEKEMKTLSFSKKVMQSQEVKTNNNIEGYFDNIEEIEEIIKNDSSIKDKEKRSRIINLYKGYKYILTKQEISKENLKILYKVLSKDLLSKYDLDHMGPYYRDDDVFIYYSDNVQIPPDSNTLKDVVFFLGCVSGGALSIQEEEVSFADWFDYDSAFNIITYNEDRNVLKRAYNYIRENNL